MDDLPPPFADLLQLKGVAVALWFVLFLVAERLLPAAPWPSDLAHSWAQLRRYGRNLLFWLVNTGLSLAIVLPVTLWATAHPLWSRPDWWSGTGDGWGWALALDLVLLDFWIYWWHRANHEWKPLWRFHEVHHLDRFLDASSAVRFHFGELFISTFVRAAVIVLLAVPIASVLVFETALLAAAIFHHSNLRLPRWIERPLSRIVITPSIHWVHHHAVRRDTDSNYGTFFSFWDRLFRSRSATARTPDMAIGVEGRDEQPWWRLALRPFRFHSNNRSNAGS